MSDGKDAIRYLDGIKELLTTIKKKEWLNVQKASTAIALALQRGCYATFISEGHHPPLATSYGVPGNPHLLLPAESLLQHFGFNPSGSAKGDVLVLAGVSDASEFLGPIAAHANLIDEYTIFVGTPADGKKIPITKGKTLRELCDMAINVHTRPGDGLLEFEGLEVSACPTSGITTILMFYVLNAEVAERISKALTDEKRSIEKVADQDFRKFKGSLRKWGSTRGVR